MFGSHLPRHRGPLVLCQTPTPAWCVCLGGGSPVAVGSNSLPSGVEGDWGLFGMAGKENRSSFQTLQGGRKCLCCTWGGPGKRQNPGDRATGTPGQSLQAGEPGTHGPRLPLCLPASLLACALLTGIPSSAHQGAAGANGSSTRDYFNLKSLALYFRTPTLLHRCGIFTLWGLHSFEA